MTLRTAISIRFWVHPDDLQHRNLLRDKRRAAGRETEAESFGVAKFEVVCRSFNPPRLKSTENIGTAMAGKNENIHPDLYSITIVALGVPGALKLV
jgi:hypothetical protein